MEGGDGENLHPILPISHPSPPEADGRQPMRVLFITQAIDRTHENLGAIHGWIEALAGEVEHVHAVALQVGDTHLPPNVSVYSLGKDRGRGKLHQMATFQKLVASLVMRRQVDLFFPHMIPRYAMLVAPYRLLFRIPSVMWYAHNTADLKLKIADRCVDRFLTVSKDSFPLGLARCDVVGHGIEADLFKPFARPEDGKTRFLSLGESAHGRTRRHWCRRPMFW